MYKIIKGESVLAVLEDPIFITISPTSGCYIAASPDKARGVAISGTPYNLFGREPMEGLETVLLVEVDAGSITDRLTADLDFVAAMTGVEL